MTFSNTIDDALNNTLVLVLAGGQGSRLKGLTAHRAKPALEFGGSHKIIDFTLSNCINSGLHNIAVLTQYKAQHLIQHLMNHWSEVNRRFGKTLDILPASPDDNNHWYRGTADACLQNLAFIKEKAPKYVVVLAGDHVYQMDYRRLLATHISKQASMTISCIETQLNIASGQLGVMSINSDGRVTAFAEKPLRPDELADVPGYCLASMGNYVFNTECLINALTDDATNAASSHDFGHDVIPALIHQHKLVAHRFRDRQGDKIPYWRDVGTLDNYWQSHMELLKHPHWIDMDDPDWPLARQTAEHSRTAQFDANSSKPCIVYKTRINANCQLDSCFVGETVLSGGCKIERGASLNQCVILPNVTIHPGAQLSKTIVDRNCTIPANFHLTDANVARAQGFTVTEKGIILVTQSELQQRCTKPIPFSAEPELPDCLRSPHQDVYLSKRKIGVV